MKTQVEFRSSKFPPCEDEEEQVNPGRRGKRLCEYLSEKLSEEGLPTKDLFPEDWGWVLEVGGEAGPVAVNAGKHDEYPDGFLCFVSYDRCRLLRRGRRHLHRRDVVRVLHALDRVLQADPDVRDILWFEENET